MDNKQTKPTIADIKYLKLLIKKSKELAKTNEPPFTALIIKNDEVISESDNQVTVKSDVTQHAEVCAMKLALTALSKNTLEGCTLYSICEPCPMCSFIIRELHISRVVYSIKSPNMGGHTKWNILEDPLLQLLPKFSATPKVVGNILSEETYDIFKGANFHYMFSRLED